jgi:tRNA (guanine37-N1)-methyltransferase
VRVDLITIFPDYFAPLSISLLGKARERGVLDVRVHDLREWAAGPHRPVDDTPYGGGPGMVMRPEPWAAALEAIVPTGTEPAPLLVVPTPSGRLFTQRIAEAYAARPWLVFACGRYEGIDARVVEEAATRMPVDEVSVGDYVLNGGEAAALVVVEAVARLLPGVVGNMDSLVDESHAAHTGGLLESPAYTKPATWRGREVPPVLRSGDHAAVARWRRRQALLRTASQRPDLLRTLDADRLDAADREALDEVFGPGWLERFREALPPMAH